MVNKTFSNLMISLINQVVQYIFICGIILTILGIALIILFERKSASEKYENWVKVITA